MADQKTMTFRVHVGRETGEPISESDMSERYLNVVFASLHAATEWEKTYPGRRYGTNIRLADGYLSVDLCGWSDDSMKSIGGKSDG